VSSPDDRLAGFLRGRLPGDGDVTVERHAFGHSNVTYYVTRGADRYVLRRPPEGPLPPGTHDVRREFRVLAGLEGSGVRAPRAVFLCEDDSVIGAPFYVMERVDGVVIREEMPRALDGAGDRRRIGEELVDALVELHAVDREAAGLGAFGKPEGFCERQVRRRSEQLAMTVAHTRPRPDLEQVAAWLADHVPESPPATLVHGDYNLHNVGFAPTPPARLVAIYDWELATVGDPLTDVGWMIATWREASDPPGSLLGDLAMTARPGFLTRAELAARYEERSGRRFEHPTFYRVLALFRLAVALEGLYALHLHGTSEDPWHAHMEFVVPALAEGALALIGGAAPL
jgi:aminoglycoside phosphotransferase (APT) family kinase protein